MNIFTTMERLCGILGRQPNDVVAFLPGEE